ncbi:hypothetical protein [Rickettsia asembonensis]|nr:hypothetical protein [Rickettsia asembonensis]
MAFLRKQESRKNFKGYRSFYNLFYYYLDSCFRRNDIKMIF